MLHGSQTSRDHQGVLLIDGTKMKSLLIPSPLRCLNVSTFAVFYAFQEKNIDLE